jgi:uncharacterized protein YbbK (DUF523 family)
MESVLVSSCLLGEAVRYNGADKRCDHHVLRRWLCEGRVAPVCPEVAGGLPIPRPPAEIAELSRLASSPASTPILPRSTTSSVKMKKILVI